MILKYTMKTLIWFNFKPNSYVNLKESGLMD